MKWIKLGKIFDPTHHALPNNCYEFAKSPQALVFDDFVRVYFSSAEQDNTGKLLSRVLYADFDKKFKNILKISKHEVIPLGKLGTFDEHGIFPFSVCRHKDRIIAYTTGWNRKASVSVDAAIGFAESSDNGETFVKISDGPILGASLHEPFLVGDAFVSNHNGMFYMWYIHGTKWITEPSNSIPQRVYKIASAHSFDGISWIKHGKKLIPDILDDEECQALPSVILVDDIYHMFFCYRHATDFRKNKRRGYKIGHAISTDLINWKRDSTNAGLQLSDNGWDSEMMCYPNVFHCDGNVFMLYNGNEFGRNGFGIAMLDKA